MSNIKTYLSLNDKSRQNQINVLTPFAEKNFKKVSNTLGRFLILILIVATNYVCSAQKVSEADPGKFNFNTIPDFITPEALIGYQEILVNYAYGESQITVPGFQLKVGSFMLPISLSHKTGGFGVREDECAQPIWSGLFELSRNS